MTKNALLCRVITSNLLAGIGLFFGVTAGNAQTYQAPYSSPPDANANRAGGFYLSGDLGAAFLQDFDSSRLGFPAHFSVHPGARLSLEPGFNFLSTSGLTLGVEGDTGIIYNRFSDVTSPDSGTDARGSFYQVPFLANIVLTMHTGTIVVPYVGVGGGGDYSEVRLRSPGFFGYGMHNDDVDPAAQGMAGVRFCITPISDLGLGYKFLADFPSEGSYLGTHSVSVTFTVRF